MRWNWNGRVSHVCCKSAKQAPARHRDVAPWTTCLGAVPFVAHPAFGDDGSSGRPPQRITGSSFGTLQFRVLAYTQISTGESALSNAPRLRVGSDE